MTNKEEDWVVIFNIKRIEEAIKKGDFEVVQGVPVVDGRHGSSCPILAERAVTAFAAISRVYSLLQNR